MIVPHRGPDRRRGPRRAAGPAEPRRHPARVAARSPGAPAAPGADLAHRRQRRHRRRGLLTADLDYTLGRIRIGCLHQGFDNFIADPATYGVDAAVEALGHVADVVNHTYAIFGAATQAVTTHPGPADGDATANPGPADGDATANPG
jgi:hypothetical protein